MVSSRSIFIFATLFVAMAVTVSSLPTKSKQSESFEATESPIDEINTDVNEIESTTESVDDGSAKLLFRNTNRVDNTQDLKFDGGLLFDQINATYKTPAVEGSQAIVLKPANETEIDQE